MKGKAGYIIVTVIIFLIGILVGDLAGGGLNKNKAVTLSNGQTVEARLGDIDKRLGDIEKAIMGGGGGLDQTKAYKTNMTGAPVLGNPDAKVKIVLWSDFQCPYCKNMAKILEDLVKTDTKKYALISKDMVVHPTAMLEHEAALAANAQGKYWEFHDLLFENQQELQQISQNQDDTAYKAKLAELAQKAGLDATKFKTELDGHNYLPQVQKEIEEARAIPVNSTPTVLINEYFYGYDPQEIKAKVQELGEGKGEAVSGLEGKIKSIEKHLENLGKVIERKKAAAEGEQRGPKSGTEYKFDMSKGPVMGEREAKVKIAVFSDYMCPYCERMSGILEGFQAEHPKDVAIFEKNFVVHPPAGIEHEAALSAAAQGKFKAMHDLLFKNQQEMQQLGQQGEDKLKEKILALGKEAGLNVSQLKADLDSGKYRDTIAGDMKEGKDAGITGTPSVFVNGYFYGYNPEDIKKQIDEALKK